MSSDSKTPDQSAEVTTEFDARVELLADHEMEHAETRGEVRHRQYKGGRIIFNGGTNTLDCLIRNISPSGAKLEISTQWTGPSHVELVIPSDALSYECEIVWKNAREFGVKFMSEPKKHGHKHDLKHIFVR